MAPVADLTHLAGRFGLEGRLAQRWSSLSGGERSRALLASVLADEPGAALDIAQQWLMMQRLRARPPGCAALVVLHDLNLASRWCDRLLVMQSGRLMLQGPTQAVLADRALDRIYDMSFGRALAKGCLALWVDQPATAGDGAAGFPHLR